MEDIIDIIVTETTNTIEITSQSTDEVIDVNIIDNREDITLNVTPTLVEININSLTGNFGVNWGDITGTLSNQTDLQNALNLKADLVGGKVPSSQLPSYVDDVVEVANYAALPATGETGKIYVTIDTNYIYRWTGSVYVEIKDSSAVWGAITGTLSSQTDLQNALNAKLNTSTAASTYVPYTGATGNVNLGLDYSITAALIIKSGGTSTQFLKADGSIDTNTYATTSQLHNPVTIGTANGLSLSTQVLSLGLASGSANGALSSTDWTTFNSKQAALSGTGFVKISGTTISYDNSTYLTTSAAASTYVSGSGTTNYLPRWSSSMVLTDSFVYTNGNYTEIQGQGLTASMGIVVSGRYGSVANAPKIYSSDETTGVAHIELVNGGGEIRLGVEKSTGGQILPGSSAYATVLTAGLSGRNLEFGTNNTKRMTISGSTGAVTLTSTITATGATLTGALSGTSATFQNTSDTYSLTLAQSNASNAGWGQWADTGGNYKLSRLGGGVYSSPALTIALGGAATFSSSVTAGGRILTTASGNDTFGFQMYKSGTTTTLAGFYQNTTGDGLIAAYNSAGTQNIQIATNGVSYFNGGNVGIGTTSPVSALTIYNNSNGLRFQNSTTGNTSTDGADLFLDGSDFYMRNIESGFLGFATANAERMRITSSGSVGIGTTLPYALLSVYGASAGDRILIDSNSGTGSNGAIAWGAGGVPNISARIKGTDDGAYGTHLIFETRGNGASGTTTTERMRITSTGSVFIGKTTGNSKFGVSGLPTSSAGLSSGDFYQVAGAVMVVP